MEQNTQTILTKASEYIKKYRLKRTVDEFSGEVVYRRELHFKDKNVHIAIMPHELDEKICYVMKQAFYKNKYDKKWGCYGVFGKARFVEGIENDIKEFESAKEKDL